MTTDFDREHADGTLVDVEIIKRVLLARLVDRDSTYYDGRSWVSGSVLAQAVAEQIAREIRP